MGGRGRPVLCWDGSGRLRVGCPNPFNTQLFLSLYFRVYPGQLFTSKKKKKTLSSCLFFPNIISAVGSALFLSLAEVEGDADTPLSRGMLHVDL